MRAFAGVDLGTGGARCLVVDERGRRIASSAHPWSYRNDASGFATLDVDEALRAVRLACEEAAAAAPEGSVQAIGVTSQRTGVVFLGASGELLISPNADGRGLVFGAALEREHRALVAARARRLPVMLYLPARLAWWRANRPDERVVRAFSLGDWLAWRMTGVAATDATHAAEMLVYDVERGSWSDELAGALDVPLEILPDLRPPGEPAGATTDASWGFGAGIPVVRAGADTQCALLALGVVDEGVGVVAGTTMLAARATHEPSPSSPGLWCSPHAVGAGFVHEAHCGEAGAAVSWLAGLLDVPVAELDRLAGTAPPGAGGLAFFDPWPARVDDFPLVRPGALRFPTPLLALGRGRADVARAVFEGLAFGALAGIASVLGNDPARAPLDGADELVAAGGVASAETFLATLASASGVPVRAATEPQSSALGAAIVAAAMHHGGIRAAVAAMRDGGRLVSPAGDADYASLYAAWVAEAARLDAAATRIGDLM